MTIPSGYCWTIVKAACVGLSFVVHVVLLDCLSDSGKIFLSLLIHLSIIILILCTSWLGSL